MAGPYRYPFGPGATRVRIDQGVDFGGSGPILAIGRAKILRTRSPWPEYSNGAGILYRLLEGPYKGRSVYVYEGVKSKVRPGQIVAAGQEIGEIVPGTSSGIETGWADPRTGQPVSRSEYTEGKETLAGKVFGHFLTGLPAPGLPAKPGRGGIPSAAEESGEIGLGLPGEGAADEVAKKGWEAKETIEDVAHTIGEVLNGLQHPEKLLLNLALLGGGAFCVYYGAALVLGAKHPVGTPLKAAAMAAPE